MLMQGDPVVSEAQMKLKFLVTVLEISHGTLMINDQEDSPLPSFRSNPP